MLLGELEKEWNQDGTLRLSYIGKDASLIGDVYYLSENYCLVDSYDLNALRSRCFFLSKYVI